MAKNITVISNEINKLAQVTEYTFMTKDGKELTVKGDIAKELSIYYGMTALGNRSTFESAHRLRNIMNMENEDLKTLYNANSGSEFITKYMGLAQGTISNYKKTADFFFQEASSEVKDQEFRDYNFSQLQELSVYIVKCMDKNKVTQEKAYQELKERVKADFPYTMSSAKIRAEVRKEFETVEEKKAKKTKKSQETTPGATPGSTPGATPGANVTTYEDLMNMAFEALNYCKGLQDCFDQDGHYKGNEIENHFKLAVDNLVKMLSIKKTETPDQDAQDGEFQEIQD